jgi:putative ABC transport system substrate-binding protein
MIRRRAFIAALGSAAAWPLAARAQQTAMPVIGWLSGRTAKADASFLPAFRQALAMQGLVEGRNISIEFRWADGQYDVLPSLAEDLVRQRVSVIVTVGGTPAALAAKASTTSIPIVFAIGVDPVRIGLVSSFNRPGNNATGITDLLSSLGSKRLGLLEEMVPHAQRIAILTNPSSPAAAMEMTDTQEAARALGRQIESFNATNKRDLDDVFAKFEQARPGALLVIADPFFFTRANQMVAVIAQLAIPTLYWRREWVTAGGLMSYGSNLEEGYRVLADYVGRILRGEKAGDLPVQQPTKFEFVINMNAAKALGLTVPITLLGRADEVIE